MKKFCKYPLAFAGNKFLSFFFIFFCSASFAQGKHLLKFTITDSIRHYLEKELLGYMPGLYELEVNVSTNDMDTVPNQGKGSKSCSLDDIKKERKKLCNCGRDANIYFSIGIMYERLNQNDSSIVNFNRALNWCEKEKRLHPDSLALLETEAWILSNKKDYNTCIERCEYILQKRPTDSIVGFLLPLAYFGSGDVDKMTKGTERMLAENPENTVAIFFNTLGRTYHLFNDPRLEDTVNKLSVKLPADSFVDFSRIYSLQKKYPGRHYYIIMNNYLHLYTYFILKILGSYGQNMPEGLYKIDTLYIGHYLSFFSDLVKQKWYSNYYAGYKGLGLSYLLLHRFKEGAECFRKSIDAFPKGTGTSLINPAGEYMTLAVCYCALRDTASAEKVIREAMQTKPKVDPDPDLWIILAHDALNKRNFAEAKKNCTEALKIKPRYAKALKILAYAAIAEKDYKTALEQCDKAYAMDKNDPDVFILGGIANLLNNAPETALSMFKIAQNAYPDDLFLKDIIDHYFF